MNAMDKNKFDLEALVYLVFDELSFLEMLQICKELQIDYEQIGLKKSQPDSINALFLVGKIHELGRTNELLLILDNLIGNVSQQIFVEPSENWKVNNPLSNKVIEKVNRFLGRPGKPYIIEDTPTFLSDWKPTARETGCYCWLFEWSIPEIYDKSENQSFWSIRYQTKELLKDEPVIVYISTETRWIASGLGETPCIVVAPTQDKFDAVRIEQTLDGNCEMGPVEWIRYLKNLDENFGAFSR